MSRTFSDAENGADFDAKSGVRNIAAGRHTNSASEFGPEFASNSGWQRDEA